MYIRSFILGAFLVAGCVFGGAWMTSNNGPGQPKRHSRTAGPSRRLSRGQHAWRL